MVQKLKIEIKILRIDEKKNQVLYRWNSLPVSDTQNNNLKLFEIYQDENTNRLFLLDFHWI